MDLFYKKLNSNSVTPTELLNVENCNDSTRIRTFLRLSRIATDDTIRQHLNGISAKDCDKFFQTKVVPQWQARAEAIGYCSQYAKHLHDKAVKVNEGQLDPQKFDLRTNPYALEDELNTINSEKSSIEDWVNNELEVERIVCGQTINVLNNSCYYKNWLAEFKELSRKH